MATFGLGIVAWLAMPNCSKISRIGKVITALLIAKAPKTVGL
jgi:hypothetical protein